MKTINIFWWKWQHASNLIDRWIFNEFSPETIEKQDKLPNELTNSAVIVWITQTQDLINKIIQLSNLDSEIINFSGIMSTTPETIRNNRWISNFHFLFWPKAKENLKVVFAWDLSQTSLKIIDNAKKQSIKIIESSIEEHDSKMAITQALTHLFIFLSWLSDNPNKQQLIKEWNTPNSTIADMIFENEFFKHVILNMTLWNNLSKTFLNTVKHNLNNEDIQNFWTPTFLRIMKFAQENKVMANDKILNFFDEENIQKEVFISKIEELKKSVNM